MEFRGVLIGGPKDGQWVTSARPDFVVAELTRITPVTTPPDEIPTQMPIKHHWYRFHEFPGRYREQVGLFVHESMSKFDALRKLMENYRPVTEIGGGSYG